MEKVSISSCGGSHDDKSINIVHLTEDEYGKVLGSIKGGMFFIRVKDGRLESFPNYHQLPSPIEDEKMSPFWRKANKNEMTGCSYSLFETEPISELSNSSPSISIQHLCGYYYSQENYKMEAEKLISYGFECLRSRRGDDGQFWEIWFLPNIIFAKGKLLDEVVNEKRIELKIKKTLEFLGKNVSFGTLDISIQRLAMRNSD